MNMERFVYLNGVFFDRVSNTAEELACSLNAWIARVEPFEDVICGPSERVYLRSLEGCQEDERALAGHQDVEDTIIPPG